MQPEIPRFSSNPKGIHLAFWKSSLCFLIILGITLYIISVRPWAKEFSVDDADVALNFLTPPDTFNYWYHAVATPLSDLPLNLLGPVTFIKLFNVNLDLIFIFYIAVVIYVLRQLSRYWAGDTLRFSVLFFANPMVLTQFLAPNKEIAIIMSLLLIILYVYSGRYLHLIFALVFAAFSKVEFIALLAVFLLIRKFNPRRRLVFLILMVLLISLMYSTIPNMSGYSEFLFGGQTDQSVGITILMQRLAVEYFLFPIVLIPRILLSLFSGFGILISTEIYNEGQLYIFISGILFIRAISRAISKRRLHVKDDAVFLLFLFLLMVSVVPFPHHRYVLPAYPLLLLIILKDTPGRLYVTRVSATEKISCCS